MQVSPVPKETDNATEEITEVSGKYEPVSGGECLSDHKAQDEVTRQRSEGSCKEDNIPVVTV